MGSLWPTTQLDGTQTWYWMLLLVTRDGQLGLSLWGATLTQTTKHVSSDWQFLKFIFKNVCGSVCVLVYAPFSAVVRRVLCVNAYGAGLVDRLLGTSGLGHCSHLTLELFLLWVPW